MIVSFFTTKIRQSFEKRGNRPTLQSALVEEKGVSMRGFTIIEAVVSVAIFSTVMVVGAGALMSIMGANRKAQTTKSAVDNLNFAIDSMTRALRTGLEYYCDDNATQRDCGIATSPGSSISFQETPSRNDRIVYTLDPITDGGTTCPAVGGSIKRIKGGVEESITSDEVHISSLKFYVYGANKSPVDTQQPRVVISATGFAGNNPKECTTFNIHTSVTQRVFEGD